MYGKKVKLRAFFIILIFISAVLTIFLVIKALDENDVYFKSPTEIKNLSELDKKKIRVGGMVKKGSIKTNETGIFASVQKDIFDGAVSLNGALRYDKAQNYDGSFTPRVGALIDIAPNHNLRVSYQTAMRTPTMQDMYIALDGGPAILFGSSPDSVERFYYDFPDLASGNTYTVTVLGYWTVV